jgi:hypothetical protein
MCLSKLRVFKKLKDDIKRERMRLFSGNKETNCNFNYLKHPFSINN